VSLLRDPPGRTERKPQVREEEDRDREVMAAMADREHTRPSRETRAEERREAKDTADAGREPTPEEEEAADLNEPDEEVAEHYREMTERGANQKGEGRVP